MLLLYFILFLSISCGAQETTETVEPTVPPTTEITEITTGTDNETVVLSTEAPEESCSNETQWACNNSSECIGLNQTCDGMINCADGSDEYLELCKDREPRPMFGLVLHCSYTCGVFHDKLCPQICCHEPQYCYYALMAENKEPNTCRLPSYPEHGNFSVVPYEEADWSLRSDRPNFWLNYTCAEPFVIVENERVECRNGELTKSEKPPYCSEACELHHNSNFTYMCPRSSGNVTCGNYVAINTPMFVTRVEPNPDDDATDPLVSLAVLCKEDKTYNLNINCVEEIDKIQKEFEDPTMDKMTKYESRFNEFKTNETSQEFSNLVTEFHNFEIKVRNNLTMMHIKAEECDIILDLLIWDLTLKKENKTTPGKQNDHITPE